MQSNTGGRPRINPSPPSATERRAIEVSIQTDERLVDYLVQELDDRRNKIIEVLATAQWYRTRVQELKKKLNRETGFETLLKYVTSSALQHHPSAQRTESELEEVDSPIENRKEESENETTSVDMYVAEYMSYSFDMLHKVQHLVQDTTQNLSTTDRDCQAAVMLEDFALKDVETMEDQIAAHRSSITIKRGAFRPIWRMPSEIWRMVFLQSVKIQGFLSSDVASAQFFTPPGDEALIISAVCRKWRTIAMGYEALWQNIVILWGKWREELISKVQHYHSLSQNAPRSLFVYAPTAYPTEFLTRIDCIFEGTESVERVVCVSGDGVDQLLADILRHLPAPKELWYSAASDYSGSVTTTVPAHHCRSIRNLVINRGKAHWEAVDDVQVDDYTITTADDYFIIPLEEFLPASLVTLRTLTLHGTTINGTIPELNSRESLPQVHTIKTSTKFFLDKFVHHYSLPRLRRIEVTHWSVIDDEQWENLSSYLNLSNIQDLVIHPMDEELDRLSQQLTKFSSATRLEIRGDSIDPMLMYWTSSLEAGNSVFPHLSLLVISSYKGGAESVVPFLHAWQLQGENDTSGKTAGRMKILLEECNTVSLETRKSILDSAQNE